MQEKRDELAHTRIDALTEHVNLNNDRVEKLIDQHSQRDSDEFTHLKMAAQRTEAEVWNAINDLRKSFHELDKRSAQHAMVMGILYTVLTIAGSVIVKKLTGL